MKWCVQRVRANESEQEAEQLAALDTKQWDTISEESQNVFTWWHTRLLRLRTSTCGITDSLSTADFNEMRTNKPRSLSHLPPAMLCWFIWFSCPWRACRAVWKQTFQTGPSPAFRWCRRTPTPTGWTPFPSSSSTSRLWRKLWACTGHQTWNTNTWGQSSRLFTTEYCYRQSE